MAHEEIHDDRSDHPPPARRGHASRARAGPPWPLVRPQDDGCDEARAISNGAHDGRLALIVRCAGVADVMRAVDFARSGNLLVTVRGGGHSLPGFPTCDDGVVVDLSGICST